MEMLLIVCVTLATQVGFVMPSAGNFWTYRGSLGPDHWHLDYKHCGGVKQSPIDVGTKDVIVDTRRLTPIVFSNYDKVSEVNYTLGNNGHTVQIDLNGHTMEISGGGLGGGFIAEQFHFHWGAVDERGSEHAVNGKHFPMEMHVVHYNKKYENVTLALDKPDGLAVLGFFFEVGRFNQHFQEIINHFGEIKYKNEHVLINSIPLVELMPASLTHYYRYKGSLTTPPCYESVSWTLFNETIEIAEEQLEDFRTAVFDNDKSEGGVSMDISDDFRPVQCLHRRRVYASQESLKYSPEYSIQVEKSTGAAAVPVASVLLSFMCICAAILNIFI